MNKTLLYALAAVVVLAAAALYYFSRGTERAGAGSQSPATIAAPEAQKGYYTCPMHPTVKSDHPGACPICGMTLVWRSTAPAPEDGAHSQLGPVSLSPSQQVLANVSVVTAHRERLDREVSAVGSIEYAEPNLSHLTLRFPGRVERLHVTYTGQRVAKGSPVADIYSPEAISAQKEYLLALESVDQTKDAYPEAAAGSQSLLEQARQKLLRWGLTEEQLTALAEERRAADTLTIFAPVAGTVTKKYAELQQYLPAGAALFDIADLSSMWLVAEIYEMDLPWIRAGVTVEAAAEAYPGEVFTGTVAFVEPAIDPGTRTTRVRITMPNPSGRLTSGMFLQVRIRVSLPPSVVVPVSAVLSTGQHSVVWTQKEAGVFQPRPVTTGARSGDRIQVLKGLAEGESVVATGGYLLDSESQLQLQLSEKDGQQ